MQLVQAQMNRLHAHMEQQGGGAAPASSVPSPGAPARSAPAEGPPVQAPAPGVDNGRAHPAVRTGGCCCWLL